MNPSSLAEGGIKCPHERFWPPTQAQGSSQTPHLHNIQAGSTCSPNVNGDGLHQGTLGKVLDLLGHCGTEEEGLPLALYREEAFSTHPTWHVQD